MFYFKKKLKNSTIISIKRLWGITILIIAMLSGFGVYAMKNDYNIAENDEKIEIFQVAENKEENFSREKNTTSRTSETIDRNNIQQADVNNQEGEQQELVENSEQEVEEEKEIETKDSLSEVKASVQNYISISDVKISKDMDLTVRTGLSKEDFKTMISNVKQDTSKFFYNNADTIYDVCEQYEINEIFFCGLISAESGWDIAGNHRRTYNYISLMSNGKLIKYGSVNEGLTIAAKKIHNNYLTPGGSCYNGKTLSGVKKKFCPASSTWVDLVYGRMKQIIK